MWNMEHNIQSRFLSLIYSADNYRGPKWSIVVNPSAEQVVWYVRRRGAGAAAPCLARSLPGAANHGRTHQVRVTPACVRQNRVGGALCLGHQLEVKPPQHCCCAPSSPVGAESCDSTGNTVSTFSVQDVLSRTERRHDSCIFFYPSPLV